MSILVTEYWRSGLNIGEMRVFPANKIAAARAYYDKLRHQNHSGAHTLDIESASPSGLVLL